MRHLDPDSETALELEPDLVKWAGRMKTNALLADIYDMLAMINANICAMGSGKKAKKPKAYPRPNDSEKKSIGKKGLPPEELRAWFDKKRKERQKRLEE